jgi:hypothetical protein
MPTRTTPRAGTAGRFARSSRPAARGRVSLSAGRLPRSPRRKPAPRSRSSQALNSVARLVPGSALGRAAKPSPHRGGRKGRAGALALLAGAAGLAMRRRRGGRAEAPPPSAV